MEKNSPLRICIVTVIHRRQIAAFRRDELLHDVPQLNRILTWAFAVLPV